MQTKHSPIITSKVGLLQTEQVLTTATCSVSMCSLRSCVFRETRKYSYKPKTNYTWASQLLITQWLLQGIFIRLLLGSSSQNPHGQFLKSGPPCLQSFRGSNNQIHFFSPTGKAKWPTVFIKMVISDQPVYVGGMSPQATLKEEEGMQAQGLHTSRSLLLTMNLNHTES